MQELQFGDAVQGTTHVISTCTATKTVNPSLRWNGHDVRSWVQALDNVSDLYRVKDLYAGPAWAASTRLFDIVEGRSYVVSAGLGLTSTESAAPSYDATFSRGADTSISAATGHARRTTLRNWWSALCRERGLTLTDLARRSDASVFVVASGAYLDAMHDDLQAALEVAGERLVVIGVDAHKRCPWLNDHAPVFDARVLRKSKLAASPPPNVDRKRLPGGTATLGTVVARDLYRRTAGIVSAPAMCAAAEELMTDLPETAGHGREQLSDNQIVQWVRQTYEPEVSGRSSATALLRTLRESGKACEQSRFRELFKRATTSREDQVGAQR